MSNLGLYQDLAIAAKAAGGVPKLIETIEREAVSKAAPSIAARSYGIGAASVAVTTVVLVAGKKFLDRRKADQVAAEEAKERLISESSDDGSQSREAHTQPATS